MFSLQDIKEYWCAISVNDDGDDGRVLRTSDDLKNDNKLAFCNGLGMDDVPIDDDWFNDWIEQDTTVAGVYKLALDPVYATLDEEEADDEVKRTTVNDPPLLRYFKVIDVTLLYRLDT